MSLLIHPVSSMAVLAQNFEQRTQSTQLSKYEIIVSKIAHKVSQLILCLLLSTEILFLRVPQLAYYYISSKSVAYLDCLDNINKLRSCLKSLFNIQGNASPLRALSQHYQLLNQKLDAWIHEAIDGEKARRVLAGSAITSCYLDQSRSLTLTHLNLSSLPDALGMLSHLEELDLSHNLFSELPDGLFTLKNLVNLSINHNKLTYVCPRIFLLKKLCILEVSYNELTNLPYDVLIHLKTLKFMDFSNNQIEWIHPLFIQKLEENDLVNFEENPLSLQTIHELLNQPGLDGIIVHNSLPYIDD